jgi:alpha-tubulin suppressor-like RCC1 family protein
MMIFQKAFLLFLIILLTSCGRGNVVFNDVITISGTVFAPAGTIAQIQEKPFSLASFIVSDLYAAVTGLTPVAGAKVELIRINNAGIQIGDVLATTTTDMNGKYSLTLPNEGMTFPSSDLVIRVKGTTASELRAIVTGTTMNVSTVSEYVLEEVIKKIADNPAAVLPSHFTTNEIVALFALVNRYSLNLNSATTTAETMTQIANATTAHMASALVDLFPPGTQKILDTDGDRVNDDQDAFPEDPTETLDTDKDSVGNNADLDDDGDAFNDTLEISVGSDPLNPLSFPDIVPPSVPSGIAATSTLTTVSIAWPASTDHVGITHYIIMRGSLIATSTTPSFIDTNLLPKTTYTYTLQACDRANNCSATSTPIMVTTLTTLTPPFLTIGGTVTGLAGGSLTLQNNSGDNLATSTNGSFVFTAPIASGSGYSVSVLTQPTTPSQTCSVTNGTGTVGNANVMNVGITCTTNTYTISGAVTGLAGGSLVLQNNSGDNLATSTNGSFVFTTSIISGSGYSVSVFAQPTTPSQTCSVTNGTGTVGNANVMNISIVCIENTIAIGGTVTGLAGSGLLLQNNSGDNLATSTNGSFVFTAPIASGSSYNVSVFAQPTTPSQTCSVTNGTGTVGNANVMNVGITCTTNTYTIGGTVTGLAGSGLVLQNNSGNNLATSTNGSFVFTTSIISGSGYSVSILTQPTTPSQTCSVTNGTGTVGNANVMNVGVTCTTNTYTIGGTVTGLAGSGLVLQNNSGDNLATSTNGSFVFTAPIASGSSYNVSVFAQPTTPSQTCSVTNGTGTASSTPITNLLVTCTTNTYTIGGAVTGLSGSGLVLQNNSGDNLATSTNGSFVFTAPIASGSSYNVSVFAQPTTPSQTCSVTNATGTASSTNVMDVSVGCGRNDYTLMVTKIGNGVVTSSIGELNCGTVCSKIYNVGQLVTLTATPDGGYLFSGWNMACNGSGTSTTCDITMNADQSVTAQFLPLPPTAPTGLTIKPSNAQVTLTWNTNPAGENVTSYTLYMAKVLGVTKTVYEMVHPNVTSPYKHIKLKNGISHYFIVTASNAGGEGTASLEVSAIPGMPIASVKQHSCAVSGSKVQCWGRNVEGQLGDGTTLTPLIPVFVSGITTATAVGTGYYHSCALLSNGVVNCWGENIFGQLGNATTTSSNAPVAVVGIATATEIWVGPYHNCALLLDGTVKCWGHNERSQLGDRTQTNRSTPVTALEITDAVAVWVGGLHSCTLLANGTVKCWGYNREGQLGDGSKIDRPVPVEVLGITTATAIAGSNDHSCALLSDGTLKCWGLNDNGQLGNGTTTSTTSPIAVLGITTGESIGAGLTHTCALLLNSTIQCWGANLSGQLGNGTATSTITTTPITVSGITTGSAVASGEAHTCAALSDYTVNCWGENDYSQLGDGAAPMDSSIPVLVREIP